MQQPNVSRGIAAGISGTLAMTALMFMGPQMGMPEMNVGKMLGDFMGIGEALGWAGHFMIGTVLALIFIFFFFSRLPGAPWLKGLLYAMIPWLAFQVAVSPMMGSGVFAASTPAPAMMVMGSLLGHTAYGIVLGAVYGEGVKEPGSTAVQS